MMLRNKNKVTLIVSALALAVFLLAPQLLFAQVSLGFEYTSDINLGSQDIRTTVIAIVNVLLGLLGVVAVLIVLYGGYIWMTAGGEPDKISQAKKILVNGLIGLLIILSAYAIVNFIVKNLGDATTGPSAECEYPSTGPCTVLGCPGEKSCQDTNPDTWGSCLAYPNCNPNSPFNLLNTWPPDGAQLPIRNVVVSLNFSHPVQNIHLDTAATITQGSTNNPIPLIVEVTVNPRKVVIRPDILCESPNNGEHCFPYTAPDDNPENFYTVNIKEGDPLLSFLNLNNVPVTCSLGVCPFTFRVGPLVDTQNPSVDLVKAEDSIYNDYPWNTNRINVSILEDFIFWARGNDDSAVAGLEFFEPSNNPIGVDSPPTFVTTYLGQSGIPSPPYNVWNPDDPNNPNVYGPGDVVNIRALVSDYAGHSAESVKQVKLWPGQCFNNICDQGESCDTNPNLPVDCGGPCPACGGERCSSEPEPSCVPDNNLCVSQICQPSCSCYPMPDIQEVNPIDGAVGNFVTIKGQGFGPTAGEVYFINNDTQAAVLAGFPSSVNPACSDNWTDTQVIVVVPNIPQNNNGYNIELRAHQPYGPEFLIDTFGDDSNESTFTQNNVQRPGLCLAAPASGAYEEPFTLSGNNFNIGPGPSINFGLPPNTVPAQNPVFTNNTSASGQVPNISADEVPVLVIANNLESNPLAFTVVPTEGGDNPFITNFTPLAGPENQYVTIFGGNFGDYNSNSSAVEFTGPTNNVPVDFGAFPAECSTDFWHNDYIVVKVPAGATIGPLTVKTAAGLTAVSADDFTFNQSIPLLPGICSLQPQAGSENEPVEVIGEYFSGTQVNFCTLPLTDPPIIGQPGHADSFNVLVPGGVQSGEVKVQNIANPTISSAGLPFEVAPAPSGDAGNFGFYDWQFKTCLDCLVPQVVEDSNCSDQLASPSPPNFGPGNESAYVNAVLGVRFNVDMNNSTFSSANYIIRECNSDPTFNETTCHYFISNGFYSGYPIFTDSSPEYVQVRLNQDFSPDTWYQIVLTNGLRSQIENFPLGDNLNFNYYQSGPDNDSFEWHFKTRQSSEPCSPNSVAMEPASRIEPDNPIERGEYVNYNACGQNDGVCAICPDIFKWSWQSSHPAQAVINPAEEGSANQLYAAGLVRQPDVGQITATIEEYLTGDPPHYQPLPVPISGSGDFNIIPPRPRIEFSNSCDEENYVFPSPNPFSGSADVCTNAIIYARFVDVQGNSINMDQNTLVAGNIAVVDENNNQVNGTVIPMASSFAFRPAVSLNNNTGYTVTLNNVLSAEGMPLLGAASWQFATGNGSCSDYTALQVEPSYKLFTAIGDTENYLASLVGNQCIFLAVPYGSSVWSSDNLAVARVGGSNNYNAIVISVGEGITNINAQVTIGSDVFTDSGRVEVNLGITPDPLTITDHQPQYPPPVCLNSLIRLDFSEPIIQGQNDPPSFNNSVIDNDNHPVSGQWQISGNGSRYEFRPDNYFDPDMSYRVSVMGGSDGIESVSEGKHLTKIKCLEADMSWWDTGPWCFWNFVTGNEICEINNIYLNNLENVDTAEATVYEGESTGWQATAYAENGNPLTNPMDNWLAVEPGIANLQVPHPSYPDTRYSLTTGQIDRQIFGTSTVDTEIFATIDATENQAAVTSSPAHLIVEPILKGPSVMQVTPPGNSLAACLNSLVSLKFDKHLAPDTVNDDNFKIRYKTDILGVELDGILTFDGFSDYLKLNASEAQELNLGNDDFMVEAWAERTSDQARVIFEKYDGNGVGFSFGLFGGRVNASLNDGNNSQFIQSTTILNDGQYYHVALVADRNGQARIYINGQEDTASDIYSIGDLNNNASVGIGAHSDNNDNHFKGSLAAVRVYKFGQGGLPENVGDLVDFQSRYPNLISPELENFSVGLWELDEGDGAVANDASAYGHHLDLVGPPEWGTDGLPALGKCFANPTAFYQKKAFFFDTILARFINWLAGDWFNFLYNKLFQSVQAAGPFYCSLEDGGDWVMENSILYSTVKFQMNRLLPPETEIKVKVKGGPTGIKSTAGWPLADPNDGDDYSYTFNTGSTLCQLDFVKVGVDSLQSEDTWLFLTPEDDTTDNVTNPIDVDFDTIYDRDKVYFAQGYAVSGQALERVPGVPPFGYDWLWSWQTNDNTVANIIYSTSSLSYSLVAAENHSGETEVVATAEFDPLYQQEDISGQGLAIVDLCQNPWPARLPSMTEAPKYYDNRYSFALSYCRDAGGQGTADDLPALHEDDFVLKTVSPTHEGVDEMLKEYLIPVPATGDIIGLRIYQNEKHLRPEDWYAANIKNPGNPITQTIDGYPALEDGRTVYVGAVNVELDYITRGITYLEDSAVRLAGQSWFGRAVAYIKDKLTPKVYGESYRRTRVDGIINTDNAYTNIYLISYNQSASPQTKEIMDQLIQNWEFNTNLEEGAKGQIIRDLNRLNDLMFIAKALNNYQLNNNGHYPTLPSGSYLTGFSTSKWPSWSQTLGAELGVGLPSDPTNDFTGCIDCSEPTLTNGGFEENSGWQVEANAAVSPITDPQFIHEGEQSSLIASSSDSAGIHSNPVDLTGNVTYEISAWVHVGPGNRAKLTFESPYWGGNFGNQWFTPPDYSGWFQLKNRFITPAGPNAPTVTIYLRSFAGASTFYADDVQLVTAGGNCGYDPETCWNPEANGGTGAFACDGGSYFYAYQSSTPVNYDLFAKAETVGQWKPDGNLDLHIHFNVDDIPVCNQSNLAAVCGDSIVTYPEEDCESDLNQSHVFCTEGFNWYSPLTVGCNDANVNPPQFACHWYNPLASPPSVCNGMSMQKCCGGFCGDYVLNTSPNYNISPNENCDYSVQQVDASGYAKGLPEKSSSGSQYLCSNNCAENGGWCGDGNWQPAFEGCDKSAPANNDGYGNGSGADDQYGCVVNIATRCQDYGGWCGDSSWQPGYEGCEKNMDSGGGWGHGNPINANSIDKQYECNQSCDDDGGWCGDFVIQENYEQCDSIVGGWDCTNGGNVYCSACTLQCSAGCPYQGICGNNIIEATGECGEVCDGSDTFPHTVCGSNCGGATCEAQYNYCDGSSVDADGCEVNRTTGEIIGTNVYNCGNCGNNFIYDDGHGHALCTYPNNPPTSYFRLECDENYHCSSSSDPDVQLCPPTDTCVAD